MTIAEAAARSGIGKRSLLQAARSGTLQTTVQQNGLRETYQTTPEWLDDYVATRRPGRPRKARAMLPGMLPTDGVLSAKYGLESREAMAFATFELLCLAARDAT